MKIELNDWQDVRDLVAMMNPSLLREWNPNLGTGVVVQNATVTTEGEQLTQAVARHVAQVMADEPNGLPADIAPPVKGALDSGPVATDDEESLGLPAKDLDGVEHHTDWHSTPAKINADGRWKARRGRDNDEYKSWVALWSTNGTEAAVAADAEPVATETHALPQDDAETAGDAPEVQAEPETAGGAAPAVDLVALVEASQEAALDASDSHMDLIKACQVFISEYGHPAYNALKAAVAPLEGAENGKAVPQFTPGERRLMRACIDNYPKS